MPRPTAARCGTWSPASAPGTPRGGGAVRGDAVPPDLQVRRLPLQRVLHEAERGDGRSLAAAAPHRAGQARAAARWDRHHPRNWRRSRSLRREGRSRRRVMQERTELVPAPGKEALARRLAATWPVGPRLDELIHRARRYRRWKRDAIDALPYIPSKGYGSLPYCDADAEPEPGPRLHRCPARLPARPGLPARRAGRGVRGRGGVRTGGGASSG